ncbi:LysM peptidoglycan-binding domain-containing protein [Deinococcus maricopensis]|uniref:Peptidoglycan-binding lysin domain protein n=1 Tax=Deinococcus maricopensis (strain DSM 21211 / LMG 22137 / NRRL B-23946 / LB-34) TaxID=709986 RepID=E8UB19_DEIML|nr:LysM peptidoglycan-binding domain-containing protein [Deinococcus maricopensis]ADV68258.1 Peptidoglycan-binding lysin domain protein [Deinococcus maricopensis DSM 21211]
MWPFGKSSEDRLKEALQANHVTAREAVQVKVQGGTAVYSGEVSQPAVINLLKLIAEGIDGIKSVDTSGVTARAAAPQAPSGPATPAAEPDAPAPTLSTVDLGNAGILPLDAGEVEGSSRLAKAAHAALRANAELKDNPVDVLQRGSTIILRGAVDNDHEVRLAEKLVRAVSGVEAVDVSGLRAVAQVRELARERDEEGVVYTVKAGDTLSAIALRYYGDANAYRQIAHANNISDPDRIQAGQRLRIPARG